MKSVAPLQRVVERLVPAVEQDLAPGRQQDDGDDGGAVEQKRAPHRRGDQRLADGRELVGEPAWLGCVRRRLVVGMFQTDSIHLGWPLCSPYRL